MVSLKGMIIRCSSIIPEIREAIFRCIVCGYYSDPVAIERGAFEFQLSTDLFFSVFMIGLICLFK